MSNGDKVTYTDGLGTVGHGVLGQHLIERGDEESVERPTRITMVVAPPSNKDRQRFLVEKLAELGVERLEWLETRHGKNRVSSASKVFSWVLAATEQSCGAWLMEVGPDLVTLADLGPGLVICQPGGEQTTPSARTVVVGPEGGFADDELPEEAKRWDLGPTILRVETAAIAAAAKLSAR
jgi:16S rRNA (uracil1498-N3)-methyltransferase